MIHMRYENGFNKGGGRLQNFTFRPSGRSIQKERELRYRQPISNPRCGKSELLLAEVAVALGLASSALTP